MTRHRGSAPDAKPRAEEGKDERASDPRRHRRAAERGQVDLINRLIGEERLLTGPEAGMARDSIASISTGAAQVSASTTPPGCGGNPGIEENWKSCRSRMR